ncbi:MAG TPA: ACT domain-containing protein, partial [Longimicrobiales bacterium]|nr:ACT domain-containing protein [Longimicrobiales bacterium]
RDGAGGLRDLHLIGWVALARYGLADPDDLLRAELLTASEHRRALRASDALLRVRNELHFRTGRRTDVLSLELQPAVAERMGYADRHFASASELFMRDLYHRADELLRVTEAFLVRADFWSPAPRRFVPTWKRTVSGSGQRRYLIRGRYLHPHPSGEEPRRDAMGLFEPFRVAQRHGVDVAPELKELVRSRLGLVDRAVRHSPDSADAFMDILRQRQGAGRALRALHESGLLSRYMPELRRISLMVQHDHHHRYTIDEHTLRVVEALDELARSQDHQRTILRDALEGVEDHAVLALAALLHDVGKGRGAGADHATRGATIAKRVCRRIGIAEAKLEDVVFLVQKHLVMSRTSQRRDLSDEALLQGFADTVVTVDRLNMLYVLTYADLSGVAPGSWSEWKGALLAELYLKTLARLTGDRSGQAAGDKRGSPADRVLRQLSPEFLRSDVDEFLAHLPSRYARALPPLLIARHFELVRELGPRTIAVDWSDSGKDPFTVLSVCAPDAPGLLAHLAGALTGSGLDVLSLDVFTRDDGIALDVFRVCEAMGASSAGAVAEELRSRAVQALESAARGELDPAVAVERQRRRQKRRKRGRTHRPADVRFEPPDAFGRTLIEVRADDEPGVLYRIASTLSAQGLNISYAKVASEKDQALDVFYVESVDRQPIPRARQVEIRDALLEGLRGSPSGSLGAVG